ncbi:thioredoxin domain-containing protein [Haloarculaceae archaeon H-GB11]|nr:thioredoxin domain-containing protein [Haloarculaceae archaeon H-GB11]
MRDRNARTSRATASDGPALSRRRLLASGGAIAATGVAGCLGGGGGERQLPVPVMGDPEASVTVAAYEDFRCPHCRNYNLNELPAIVSEYVEPGTIRYEHRDFPVVNETSWRAANAARAVQEAGSISQYWQFAKLLFENQRSLSLDTYEQLGNEVGVDGAKLRDPAKNQTYNPTIKADRQRGADIGVKATPTIVVNGSFVTDANGNVTHDSNAIAAAIEQTQSESG